MSGATPGLDLPIASEYDAESPPLGELALKYRDNDLVQRFKALVYGFTRDVRQGIVGGEGTDWKDGPGYRARIPADASAGDFITGGMDVRLKLGTNVGATFVSFGGTTVQHAVVACAIPDGWSGTTQTLRLQARYPGNEVLAGPPWDTGEVGTTDDQRAGLFSVRRSG
jgi:hypothetical protein